MPFEQIRLDQSINQSRDIFDKYIYRTDVDTLAQVQEAGYFAASRFRGQNGNDWAGSLIEVTASDGYQVYQVGADGTTLAAVGVGVGFRLGPVDNIFGATSGDATEVPLSVTPAANRSASETVRDAYFVANPAKLAQYDAVGAETLGILLYFADGSDVRTVAQTRLNNGWVDSAAIISIQGPAGADGVQFEFATEDERDTFFSTRLNLLRPQLPINVTVDTNTVAIQSWNGVQNPATYDNTLWAAVSIRAGTSSFELDQAVTMSAGGENVAFQNNATGDLYHPLWQTYADGRATAIVRDRDNAASIEAQSVDTEQVTNPNWTQTIPALRPFITPGATDEEGQTIRWVEYKFHTSSVTTNVRLRGSLNNVLFLDVTIPSVTVDPVTRIGRITLTIPGDVRVGDSFENLITSPDGDVVLLGDTNGVPFINVNISTWDDKTVALLEDLNQPTPVITQFRINGQATMVDPNTSISGSQTFQYNVTNTASISGTGTIRQGASVLSTTVDPSGSSVALTVDSVTLSAGQSVTWTLEFTTNAGATISDTFTVQARQQTEMLYYGTMATDADETVDINTLTLEDIVSGSTFDADFVTPDTHYYVILSPADRDITSILERTFSAEILSTFTKTESVRTIASQQYDSYVRQNNSGVQGTLATTITVG